MEAIISIREYLKERSGESKVSILRHPLFLGVLAAKIAVLFFFTSAALTQNYSSFVNFFVHSNFGNPYEWALTSGAIFPFPALMLYIEAASKLIFGFIPSDAFVLRIPVLLADVAIFLVLARWLRDKKEKVLWYYWCSPILFGVCYLAGFLDIIPIAFLFAFLHLLFKEKRVLAFTLLGFALATKTGLVILLPFILFYLLKEQVPLLRALELILLSSAVYILLNLPYLFSYGFWQIVFSGGHSFTSAVSVDFGGVIVYLVPLVYLGLVAGSAALVRLHKNIFLMFLAFALGAVTLFVVPEAGWYAWIMPFFIYFFLKEDQAGALPLVLLNLFFFGYFILAPNSVFAGITSFLPTIQSPLPLNMAFTLLQGTLLLNIVYIYRLGIQSELRHKIFYKPYLIGIAGDSASGKSTLTSLIAKVFGEHNTLEVAGDDMHKWERGDPNWSLFTHLNPLANRLHGDLEHALRLKKNKSVTRSFYDHALGRFSEAQAVRPKKVIVFQGLHALYLNRMRESLDLKIFLAPEEELRRSWKIERDSKERGHSEEHVLKQLDERAPDAQKYIDEQRKYADVILSFNKGGAEHGLSIESENSIDIDPFVEMLKSVPSLQVGHEHGNFAQHVRVKGDVSVEIIDEAAYALAPVLWDIHGKPEWKEGLSGVAQLFLTYVIFYKMKFDHELR